MRLSIITINYNNYDGLKRTIDSVMSQTCTDFEWIVIDGGSTDGSCELIGQNQARMTYWCSEPDKGIYNAMNKGIAKANGEYLQFLNSGDILKDEKVVENVLPYLQDKVIYLTNMYHAGQIGKLVVNPISLETSNLLHTIAFGSVMHPTAFTRRDCFERYGFFNENMKIISDWLFFFKVIIIHNVSVSYIPIVTVVFDESGISTTQPTIAEKEKEDYLKKNVHIGQLLCFYQDNYDIINSLKRNRFVFLIFRIYFFLFRKLCNKKSKKKCNTLPIT